MIDANDNGNRHDSSTGGGRGDRVLNEPSPREDVPRDAATAWIRELENRLRQAEADRDEARARNQDLEQRLAVLVSRTKAGLASYEASLEKAIAPYRSQRTWKIALAIRRTYALLAKARMRKLVEFIWSRGLNRANASKHDAQFPDLANYVPAELLDALPQAPPPHAARYDVIIFPVFEFWFRFQRPQQIAVEFARRGHRVFWVSPAQPARPGASSYEASPLRQNLWEVRLRAPVPNLYFGELGPRDVEAIVRDLDALGSDWSIDQPCAVVELPFWRQVGLALQRRGAVLLYDCVDNWETFPDLGAFTRDEETPLLSQCDVLAVTSEALWQKHLARGFRPLLVRNGVDHASFTSTSPSGLVDRYRRPIVGYIGAIADWFDYELLCSVATLRPMYTFVLVGGRALETDPDDSHLKPLRALPNVVLLGHKDHQLMPAFVAAFDACVIPFVLNDLTHATDPVKLYEYFSLGKPVVATAMNELRQCGDLVYVAKNAHDFVVQLDLALAEAPDDERRRRRSAFSAESTWEIRVAALDKAIRSAGEGKADDAARSAGQNHWAEGPRR